MVGGGVLQSQQVVGSGHDGGTRGEGLGDDGSGDGGEDPGGGDNDILMIARRIMVMINT